MEIPSIGDKYKFLYPVTNEFGVKVSAEWRTIIVTAIQDTASDPIDAGAVAAAPLIRRGRWLVTGWDLDRRGMRSFYLDWADAKPLRLALIVDGERVLLGGPSKPSKASRRILGQICQRYLTAKPGTPESRFRLGAVTA